MVPQVELDDKSDNDLMPPSDFEDEEESKMHINQTREVEKFKNEEDEGTFDDLDHTKEELEGRI